MSDPDNPILSGTQMDYAWDAWQKAQFPGTANRSEFDAWWSTALTKQWPSVKALMQAAWDGSRALCPTFDMWWKQILDDQPVTTP